MAICLINDLLSKDEARNLVNLYCSRDNPGNKEIPLEEIVIGSPLNEVLERAKRYFDLFKKNIYTKKHIYYDKVVAIKNANGEGQTHPMHFDESISTEGGNLALSAFVSLIYLSDDFEGGQLYFPFQNEVIEPKIGRMLIFPTGPMYSHKIFPFYGKDRHLLRIFHVFDTELEGKDKEDLTVRLQIKQEKKEL